MEKASKVLVISNDFGLFEKIANDSAGGRGTVSFARPDDDYLESIRENETGIVFLDSPDLQREALPCLKSIKKFDPLVQVIVGGGPADQDAVTSLINAGAAGFMPKPYKYDSLWDLLQKIEQKRSLRKETYRLERKLERKYNFEGMISRNPDMLEIFALIEGIAGYFTTALITGETGTGKEVAARAIHALGPRRAKPFVVCECTSVPENLFESELFGYKKGAFTGADRDKRGLFEEAEAGTIFLDEIADVPPAIQAKLLRAIETREFRPIGGRESRRADVRILAATNRNLPEMVASGAFREDLFHRLNKVHIELPPLRQRPEDIPLLARHFIDVFNEKFSKKLKGISRNTQKLFLRYLWPGNVRELKNVIEGAAMLSHRDFLDVPDLPKYLRGLVPAAGNLPQGAVNRLSTLKDMEKDYIRYLLKLTKGNLRRTAKILGISRTTLYNKIRRHGLGG